MLRTGPHVHGGCPAVGFTLYAVTSTSLNTEHVLQMWCSGRVTGGDILLFLRGCTFNLISTCCWGGVRARVCPGEIRTRAPRLPPGSETCCFVGSGENDEGRDYVESCWSGVSAHEQNRKIVGHSGFPVV